MNGLLVNGNVIHKQIRLLLRCKENDIMKPVVNVWNWENIHNMVTQAPKFACYLSCVVASFQSSALYVCPRTDAVSPMYMLHLLVNG